MRRLSAVFIAVALSAAAACSSPEEPPSLALSEDASVVADTVAPSTSVPPSPAPGSAAVDDTKMPIELAGPSGLTPAAQAPEAEGDAPRPRGSEAPAPGGGGGAPADVMTLYVGVLGNLAVDQVLATAPVAMPAVPPGVAPLTGLPSERSATSAIVVKVDNSSKARPQAGLENADVVIEQEVEGGITRLAVIFHSSAPERIGPVRSARSTDISFLSALGQPGLAYSGANEVFDTLIVRQERVRNYSAARFGGYWRDSVRSAPANLYTSMSQFSTQGVPPPAWFHFGPGATGTPVSSFVASFPATNITWTWSGSAWSRAQDGKPHTSESGAVLEATNVVVAQVEAVDSGLKDPTGAIVPEFVWAGEGPASVFTNGTRTDGRWIRPTLGDAAVFVDANDNIIELQPGTTWVELTRSLP